jgi:hypothetical protein
VVATVETLSPTSRVVHIVNRDRIMYRDFVVQSTWTPRITGATAADKRCSVQPDGSSNGVTFIWRYRASCKRPLAPGRAFDIRVTTEGGGKMLVFVGVNGALMRINK